MLLDWFAGFGYLIVRSIVNHPLAALLCSSVGGARRREVAKLFLGERITYVVHGFHLMHIERNEDPEIPSDLDQVLRSILEALPPL